MLAALDHGCQVLPFDHVGQRAGHFSRALHQRDRRRRLQRPEGNRRLLNDRHDRRVLYC